MAIEDTKLGAAWERNCVFAGCAEHCILQTLHFDHLGLADDIEETCCSGFECRLNTFVELTALQRC